MKRSYKLIPFLIISLFVMTLNVMAAESVKATDAINHIGETKTVCGTVASTYYSYKSRGNPTFLNLDRPYPSQVFTVVIWGSDRSKFPEVPEVMFRDKAICVTGNITSYKGIPQIVVRDPSQIEIK